MRFLGYRLIRLAQQLVGGLREPTAPPAQPARIDYHRIPPARPRRRRVNHYEDTAA